MSKLTKTGLYTLAVAGALTASAYIGGNLSVKTAKPYENQSIVGGKDVMVYRNDSEVTHLRIGDLSEDLSQFVEEPTLIVMQDNGYTIQAECPPCNKVHIPAAPNQMDEVVDAVLNNQIINGQYQTREQWRKTQKPSGVE